jgi:predicted nucleic acid-binding protein
MIAADSSSLIAYLSGLEGGDVDAVDRALLDNQLYLPPVVLTELLSDPKLPKEVVSALRRIPLLELTPAVWERAGGLRSKIIQRKRRARLAESLIAQSCLDCDVALITRDADFRVFSEIVGVKIALP